MIPAPAPRWERDLPGGLAELVGRWSRDPGWATALGASPHEALASAGLDLAGVPDSPLPADLPGPPGVLAWSLARRPRKPGPGVSPPLEIRLVQYSLRPMALLHLPHSTAHQVIATAARLELHAVVGPWFFRSCRDERSHGYVNVAADQRLAPSDADDWAGVLVSRDARRVALGWLALLLGWDAPLGRLLGYPDCCVAAYPSLWREARQRHRGEVGDVLVRRHDPGAAIRLRHPAANVFARHFGVHLVEHFPCHFDCRATAELADGLGRGLAGHEPGTARSLLRGLSTPVFRHRSGRTFAFPGGHVDRRGRLSYHEVWASDPTSDVSRRLRRARTLEPSDEGWLLLS